MTDKSLSQKLHVEAPMILVSDLIGRGLIERDISIRQLAELSGVKQRTIESYLYADVTPALDKFLLIVIALGYQMELKKS